MNNNTRDGMFNTDGSLLLDGFVCYHANMHAYLMDGPFENASTACCFRACWQELAAIVLGKTSKFITGCCSQHAAALKKQCIAFPI